MKKLIAVAIALVPSFAFAQAIVDANTLTYKLTNIGNTVIGILIAFAVIWIIWNVIRYIIASDDPENRKKYGYAVLWGIVGLFLILSIWGLVRILTNTFRTDATAPVEQFPRVQYPSQVP
jgi:hypothetical protein